MMMTIESVALVVVRSLNDCITMCLLTATTNIVIHLLCPCRRPHFSLEDSIVCSACPHFVRMIDWAGLSKLLLLAAIISFVCRRGILVVKFRWLRGDSVLRDCQFLAHLSCKSICFAWVGLLLLEWGWSIDVFLLKLLWLRGRLWWWDWIRWASTPLFVCVEYRWHIRVR